MQRTNIYLEKEQLLALKFLAAEERQSVANLVREAVDDYLARRTVNQIRWRSQLEKLLTEVRSRVPVDTSSAEPK